MTLRSPDPEQRARPGEPGRDLVRTPSFEGGDPVRGAAAPARGPAARGPGGERPRSERGSSDSEPAAATTGADAHAAEAPARGSRGPFLVLGALAAVGCLQLLFMVGLELNRTIQHREAIATLEREVSALQREAQGLRAVIEHGEDPGFREQLARKQGFMFPDETRVIVVPQERP